MKNKTIYCGNCGKQMYPRKAYCTECGRHIDEDWFEQRLSWRDNDLLGVAFLKTIVTIILLPIIAIHDLFTERL